MTTIEIGYVVHAGMGSTCGCPCEQFKVTVDMSFSLISASLIQILVDQYFDDNLRGLYPDGFVATYCYYELVIV